MKLLDAHNYLLTQRKEINTYLNKFKKQGLSVVILAIFLSENKLSVNKIIDLIDRIENKKNIYFSIEDISSIDYNDLDRLKEINPLYCSLTWNDKNKLGGGTFSKRNITNLGYKYINKIEEFSFVDTAHLNKKSFYSIAKHSKKPLLNSHTNLFKIYRHKRNLTNKQIKTIIKSSGLICLTGVKEFLGENSNLDTYIDSIYYFYKKFGSDNLGLSSDFMGSHQFPLVYKDYNDFKIIYKKLKEKGLKKCDLDKIFYLNIINFFNINKNNNGE